MDQNGSNVIMAFFTSPPNITNISISSTLIVTFNFESETFATYNPYVDLPRVPKTFNTEQSVPNIQCYLLAVSSKTFQSESMQLGNFVLFTFNSLMVVKRFSF